ncbi:MAG: GH32 C-terminal domain-containing protein [Phaeodactylibacter sp.]|nr:GH32 C-terminal domain-containing protein [Phaeodactylibacter sp.]
MKKSYRLFLFFVSVGFSTLPAQDYTQKYRPQFHFSPASGWIGDPTGAIRFQDTYRLFWWGQATSEDLVFWEDKGWAMTGDNGTFDYYTGSVVVDVNNRSGFGTAMDTAMVAIYTMNNRITGFQSQGISTSLDYEQFQYYSGNPVIPSNSTDFRDPQVFWDVQTERWIMVITRPLDRAIEVYASDDLISWTYLSKFEREGAQKEVWEVPDLFQLPLDGDPSNMKWVMTCGMGPNRTQYWVGDFDGTTFTMDEVADGYINHGEGIGEVLFEDFENGYNGWTATGNAFGANPAPGALGNQGRVLGFLGDFLANTYQNGDFATGMLTSPDFQINHSFINFLISGGNFAGNTEIRLIVDGQTARAAQGNNSEILFWESWDVSEFLGATAKLQIVDNAIWGWGHILVDNIYFSNTSMGTKVEHAYWADWAPDFYAAKSFKDYDNAEDRVVWLGWMNNWRYANNIPTTWGASTGHSVPRSLSLVSSSTQGYKLVQQPIEELKKLREDSVVVGSGIIENTLPLNQFEPSRNTYEMIVTFDVQAGSGQDFGLNLCVKGNKKLVLGYNEKTSELYLNRVNASDVFIANFNSESRAPVIPKVPQITFHIFIDQLSAEVFVNDGEYVFTSLIFPAEDALGIELFSKNAPVSMSSLRAWQLASIWGVLPTGSTPVRPASNDAVLFPNPVRQGETLWLEQFSEGGVAWDFIIFTADGKLAFRQNNVNSNGIPIDLPPGFYLVALRSEKETIVVKLTVLDR